MTSSDEQFIKVENDRDVLFIFGAGTSIAEGAPLQKDILKLIYKSNDKALSSSEAAIEIREFISENFDVSEDNFPSLESRV